MGTYLIGIARRGEKATDESGDEAGNEAADESGDELPQESFRRFEGQLNQLIEEGDARPLAVAGPLKGDDDRCGVLLFRTDDRNVVQSLVDSCAEVSSGRLRVQLFTQYMGKGLIDAKKE